MTTKQIESMTEIEYVRAQIRHEDFRLREMIKKNAKKRTKESIANSLQDCIEKFNEAIVEYEQIKKTYREDTSMRLSLLHYHESFHSNMKSVLKKIKMTARTFDKPAKLKVNKELTEIEDIEAEYE